ncbi:MAG: hypothetical protein AAGF45_09950 [Pseudomonadota bacterium]
MRIELDEHAIARLERRGATPEEATITVRQGARSPARHGRTAFTYEFIGSVEWLGTRYRGKRIICYAAPIEDGWRIITVIVKFLRP